MRSLEPRTRPWSSSCFFKAWTKAKRKSTGWSWDVALSNAGYSWRVLWYPLRPSSFWYIQSQIFRGPSRASPAGSSCVGPASAQTALTPAMAYPDLTQQRHRCWLTFVLSASKFDFNYIIILWSLNLTHTQQQNCYWTNPSTENFHFDLCTTPLLLHFSDKSCLFLDQTLCLHTEAGLSARFYHVHTQQSLDDKSKSTICCGISTKKYGWAINGNYHNLWVTACMTTIRPQTLYLYLWWFLANTSGLFAGTK